MYILHVLYIPHQVFNIPWPHPGYEMAFYKSLIQLQPKIRDNFAIYSNISELLKSHSNNSNEDNEMGRKMLKETTLIQENFLQLNVYFQVWLTKEGTM